VNELRFGIESRDRATLQVHGAHDNCFDDAINVIKDVNENIDIYNLIFVFIEPERKKYKPAIRKLTMSYAHKLLMK